MGNILWPKSSAPVKDDTTRAVKSKTDPDSETLIKRTRLSQSDDPTTSEEYCSARGVKRKTSEHGEGEPMKKKEKKGRLDLNLVGKESAPSEDSGIESCNTSVEDVRVGKRKAAANDEGPKRKRKRMENKSVDALRAEFEAKYKEQDQLGKGGYGTVFGGYRKADNLPVAIKHIAKENIGRKHLDATGKQLPMEVAIMLKLEDKISRSVGMSAPVSLLDWYDLDQELILVLERPIPAETLFDYINYNGGSLQEQEAKIILKQLVDAAIDLEKKQIFHRDIKINNILIETSSDVPRVRLIDFGLSCFVKRGVRYCQICGAAIDSPPEWSNFYGYSPGPSTVWQIGVVLSHTLHGDVVFENPLINGGRISETLSKNCQDFLRRCIITDPKQHPTLEQLRIHPWLQFEEGHGHVVVILRDRETLARIFITTLLRGNPPGSAV
ncbi:serine/threonine-protein kinase pim-1-like [Anarhichas minor]|uniref:serine/threonine-protein kinase pim-1-like n=1 Tax=Anarhichas minor TaxID=65739 RepID=UPI003F73A722